MTSVGQGSHFALPSQEAAGFCKQLGLAISNISVYGMDHSVTATSLSEAYTTLVTELDLYGPIEILFGDAGLLLNGVAVETHLSTIRLLTDQLSKLAVSDFEFAAPAVRAEFNAFMAMLASVPGSGVVSDGFEAAFKEAAFTSIRVSGVSYARVDKQSASPPPATKSSNDASLKGVALTGETNANKKVFDLDMAMGIDGMGGLGEDVGAAESPIGMDDFALASTATSYLSQKRAAEDERNRMLDLIRRHGTTPEDRHRLRQQLLDAGLTKTEWNDLLAESGVVAPKALADEQVVETLRALMADVDALVEQDSAIENGRSTAAMEDILQSISDEIEQLTSKTRKEASTLADKVDTDRQAIAKVEADARAQGIGLEISREELLSSLAEINQELAQPLSTAGAVVEMLTSGKLGDMPDGQRDALAVAAEGMERLGTLISYLNRISGLPDALSPDRNILDDAYAD